MRSIIDGVVPVMLTPFTDDGNIDYAGLSALIDWYIENEASALFSICQSSEMQKLTTEESVSICKFVLDKVNGRIPVIASGHVSNQLDEQIAELVAIADSGVDALVFVTNRLDIYSEGFDMFRQNLQSIMNKLPSDLPLGLYECPSPFRRLLSDDEIKLCRDTGRFLALKDVSCDLQTVKRRIRLVEGTNFNIVNANAAIAFDAMKAGSTGFAGVFTNFHPDLYAWLYKNKTSENPLVLELANFLALAACAEPMGYPGLAKLYHQRLGTFKSSVSRVIGYDLRERHWAIEDVIDHIHTGTLMFRQRVKAFDKKLNGDV